MAKPRVLAVGELIGEGKKLQGLFKMDGGPYESAKLVGAQEALDRLDDGDFDIVVTDAGVEGMKVEDLIAEIRGREKCATLPIMVIGKSSTKDEVVTALRAGADDFLYSHAEVWMLRERIRLLTKGIHKGRTLGDEQIDALPDPLTQFDIDRVLWPNLPDPAKPIITYDFRHPTQVSKDQIRTLENLHANLARMMAANFSNIMRSVVDVEIAFIDQTTYAEFIMSLSNPSCSYTFTPEPLGGPAILDFSLPIAFTFVDRDFGGSGKSDVKEPRPITAIERRTMAGVATRTLADLEATWAPLIKLQVADAEMETNPEFMQVAAPSDTVILIAFEFNSQHCSGLVNLCYPYFTIEPVLPYFNIQPKTRRSPDRRHEDRQRQLLRLKDIPAEVRVVWGRGDVAAADLAGIREGDTIVLQTRADDPAVVYLEDQPLFQARAGSSERGRYAAEVLQAMPPVDRFDAMNLEGRHNV